jgi:succinate-semialdehyde dehydrogenase/glutarate-semialdehyde dehydrogenase
MANYPEIELYIDGCWKRASGQPIINPADESILGTVPTATTADLDDALAAAERGFAIWRKTSPVCTENLNPDVVMMKSGRYRV